VTAIITPSRIRAARAVAISADALQIVFFPLFSEGLISPLDDLLDAVVCIALTWLVGWHYAFLPSFLVKLAPVADLVPTWTIAVLLATRQRETASQPGTSQVFDDGLARPELKAPPEQ
jgi:hypothetical protein